MCVPLCALLYPLLGQIHFLTRPSLWRLAIAPFCTTAVAALGFLAALYVFTFEKQDERLESWGCKHTFAELTAHVAIWVECSILTWIFFSLAFGKISGQILLAVLRERDVDKIVLSKFGEVMDDNTALDDMCDSFKFQLLRIPLMIVTLPLLGIPGFGALAWPMVNGWVYTWELLFNVIPYIGYKGCCSQLFGHALRNAITYTAFGFVALLTELIPVIGILANMGNAAGSAFLFEEYVKSARPAPFDEETGRPASAVGGRSARPPQGGAQAACRQAPRQQHIPLMHQPSTQTGHRIAPQQAGYRVAQQNPGLY